MRAFIELLNLHKVRYIIVGGFAVNLYGYVRLTQDIDILIDPIKRNAIKILHYSSGKFVKSIRVDSSR